jgi:hypothetical protein
MGDREWISNKSIDHQAAACGGALIHRWRTRQGNRQLITLVEEYLTKSSDDLKPPWPNESRIVATTHAPIL